MGLSVSAHTTKAFDRDLLALKRMVAEMGGRAARQLIQANRALVHCDRELAQLVVSADEMLDAMQSDIEAKAVAVIATRQPLAVDLRGLVGVLRVANDLERIGDLAKNIAKRSRAMECDQLPRGLGHGLTHIMSLAVGLLNDALDSFVAIDGARAARLRHRDDGIDQMYNSLFRELLTSMMEDPGSMTVGIHLLFCAKNIERVGDHVINLAEAVLYMENGRPLLAKPIDVGAYAAAL